MSYKFYYIFTYIFCSFSSRAVSFSSNSIHSYLKIITWFFIVSSFAMCSSIGNLFDLRVHSTSDKCTMCCVFGVFSLFQSDTLKHSDQSPMRWQFNACELVWMNSMPKIKSHGIKFVNVCVCTMILTRLISFFFAFHTKIYFFQFYFPFSSFFTGAKLFLFYQLRFDDEFSRECMLSLSSVQCTPPQQQRPRK